MKDAQALLTRLFEKWSSEKMIKISPIAPSGSNRKYFRLESKTKSVIGAYNPHLKENTAFVKFTEHFHDKGLPVPQVFAASLDDHIYIQEDLGDQNLYSLLPKEGEEYTETLIENYRKTISQLAKLQIRGDQGLDYKYCYPRAAFDRQSILWDLNTFKYYFLNFAKVVYDEQALEEDFERYTDYLLKVDTQYFMMRDCQSRNIMLKDGEPYFIDYQGGRKGALQYDLASLLYQAKANMPQDIRTSLLNHYLNEVEQLIDIDRNSFTEYYYAYVLVRCMQVFGTYGRRGIHEQKPHFLASIPYAIKNVKWILDNVKLPVELPELWKVLQSVAAIDEYDAFDKEKGKESPLVVTVNSFSYKKQYPVDTSGNGGGFVFDCRSIHNPGRYEPYKKITGRDEPVITFLKEHSHVASFLQNAYGVVDKAVENYIERGFTSLTVSFGCTGGQHRSVYTADCMAKHLEDKYGVKVKLNHIVQEEKNWVN